MANTILTIGMITREATAIAANSLRFGANVLRKYDEQFARKGAKIGSSLDVRIPPRYLVTDAEALVTQDTTQTKRTLTISYSHVGLEFSQTELLLSLNDFSRDVLKPAVSQLMNRIDLAGTNRYEDVFGVVGTTGSGAPTALSTYLQAGAQLGEQATPDDGDWTMAINHNMNEKIVDALKGLFHAGPELSGNYREGRMDNRRAAGFKWVTDQNMFVHTCGSRIASADVTVNGASQTGTSLIIAGTASKTYKKGDVFTITSGAAVNSVNPQSRQSTGRAQQFVLTADVTADGAGAATLSIYPAITPSGKDQTVTASPDNSATVTFNGAADATGAQGLAFQREAFALAFVDEELPPDVSFAGRTSQGDAQGLRLALSIIRQYDISTHKYPCRIGAYYGWITQRPEFAVRIAA